MPVISDGPAAARQLARQLASGAVPPTKANAEKLIDLVEADGVLDHAEVDPLEQVRRAVDGARTGTPYVRSLLAAYANTARRALEEAQGSWSLTPFGFFANALDNVFSPFGFSAPKPGVVVLAATERSLREGATEYAAERALTAARLDELIAQYPTAVVSKVDSTAAGLQVTATPDVEAQRALVEASVRAGSFDDADLARPLREYLDAHHG